MENNSAADLPFSLDSIELNEPRFLSLLEKLIGETRYLQNSPAQGLIPQEDLAAKHVLDVLTPFSVENGGPLILQVSHKIFYLFYFHFIFIFVEN